MHSSSPDPAIEKPKGGIFYFGLLEKHVQFLCVSLIALFSVGSGQNSCMSRWPDIVDLNVMFELCYKRKNLFCLTCRKFLLWRCINVHIAQWAEHDFASALADINTSSTLQLMTLCDHVLSCFAHIRFGSMVYRPWWLVFMNHGLRLET